MMNRLMALPVAVAMVLGTQAAVLAADTDLPTTGETTINEETPKVENMGGGGGRIGADAVRLGSDVQIADLPAGHWATNATMVAVANNILALEGGSFQGQRTLTSDELRRAMESMVNTAENIAGKGALTELRAAIGVLPTGTDTVTRLELAQVLARFLDAAKTQELVAMAAPREGAVRFKDLGASVPPAVISVVDRYKVMTGYPDGTFKPNDTVSRFQMAAIAHNILMDMREAPIAQAPVAPVVVQPQPPTVVVVPPAETAPVEPTGRLNFRQRTPVNLSWQALNQTNLTGGANPFNVIPVQGMITGYQGPLMLQSVSNFRYDVFQSNLLDNEFRLGYNNLKWNMFQLIPYVGANVGVGASIPSDATQYDAYVGATYGGIISMTPFNNLELWGSAGQSALLAGSRFGQNFAPLAYPGAMGSFLNNYGIGLDFYVSPNIALSLGVNNWQQPADLRTASSYSGAVDNILGGNVGVGFSF